MATTKLVAIKSLKKASFNPLTRVKDVNGLAASISEVGLLDPIKVNADMSVIDGHRRIAAYEKLGLAEIEAIVLKGDMATLYAHINYQAKRLNGNESLSVFLKEPKAVGPFARQKFSEAEEVLGRAMLERMAESGLSYKTYATAKRLASEADQETPETIKKIAKWLVHFGLTGVVLKALAVGTPPGLLMAAVNKNKTIRPSFAMKK